ncbi:MAG: transglutaminase-like domain-containing protein [Anaerolineales bacterium]
MKLMRELRLGMFIFGALVILIFYSMGLGLTEVVRGLESNLVWMLMAVGLVFGWGLMKLAKRPWTAVLLAVFSGLLFSAVVVGRLWDEISMFFQNMAFWWGTVFKAISGAFQGDYVPPSMGTFFIYLYDLTDSFYIMLQRFVVWLLRFPNLSKDLVANLTAWGLFIWLAVVWAAWSIWRRKRPLEAIIPAFLAVAFTRIEADATSSVVLVMMGMSIALMILSSQLDRETSWRSKGIGFSELIRKNTVQSALALSVLLVVVSSGITSIDLDKLRERWDEFTSGRNPGSEVNPVPGDNGIYGVRELDQDRLTAEEQFNKMGIGGLPTDHLIGSGPELSEEVVMIVRVEELDPISGEEQDVDMSSQTYYFRSLTYDSYSSQGWLASPGRIYVYQPGQEAITKYNTHQRLIRQEVRFEGYIGGAVKIHTVGEPAALDREYRIDWREGSGLGEFDDMFGGMVSSRSYEAFSVVPAYSEDGLRQTDQIYPDWMEERYLALPDTVPDRVIDLAYEITNRELTAYDRVVAIEQYLRTFPYTLDLPLKPASLDIADYFLFDLKTGYCDYYASTMVVLTRALGIPARLAVGYVGGTYDEENDYLVVTADQAHAWVEVYFPEYGWVTFEPTAGRTAVDREKMAPLTTEFIERDLVFEEKGRQLSGLQITLWVVTGLVGLGLVGFLAWLQVDIFLLKQQPIGKAFGRMYNQLLFLGRMLKIEHGIAQTPLEFSAKMADRLEIMRLKHGRFKYLEKTPRRVEGLVVLANKAAYHSEAPDVFDRALAVEHWVTIRRHIGAVLLWDWLTGLWPKINLFGAKNRDTD